MAHYHAALKCGCSIGFDIKVDLPLDEPNVAAEMDCDLHGTQISEAIEKVEDCTVCPRP